MSMNSEKELQVFYFSTLLAKALKENDGDQFIYYYDQICAKVTENVVIEKIKDQAREFSELPLEDINSKLVSLEDGGAQQLKYDFNKSQSNNLSEESNELISSTDNNCFGDTCSQDLSRHNLEFSLSETLFLGSSTKKGIDGNIFSSKDNLSFKTSLKEENDLVLPVLNPNLSQIESKNSKINNIYSIYSAKYDKNADSCCNVSKCIDFSLQPTSNISQVKNSHNKIIQQSEQNQSHAQLLPCLTSTDHAKDSNLSVKDDKKENKTIFTTDTNFRYKSEDSCNAQSLHSAHMFKNPASSLNKFNQSDKLQQFNSTSATSKRKKRTIKEFLREKQIIAQQNLPSVNPSRRKNKNLARKEEEKRKRDLLTDATVQKILQECGEDKNKHYEKRTLSHLDRKKAKRRRKQAKKTSVTKKTDLKKKSSFSEHDIDDVNIRKSDQKHANIADDLQSQNIDIAQSISPKSLAAGDASIITKVKQPDDRLSFYKRDLNDKNDCDADKDVVITQKPSKLQSFPKCVLDSTGCSAASNSEDLSSTSSSSSNTYQTDPTEPFSPVFADHANVLDSLSSALLGTQDVEKSIAQTQIKDIEIALDDKIANKNKCDEVANTVTTKQTSINFNTESVEKSLNSLKLIDKQNSEKPRAHANDLETYTKPNTVSTSDKRSVQDPTHKGNLGLRNKWGLDFFVDDFKHNVSDTNKLMTFSDFESKDVSNCKYEEFRNKDNKAVCKFPHKETVTRIKVKRASNSKSFILEEAASTLYQEWKYALKRGMFYKDL